jgi:hypothetical protein
MQGMAHHRRRPWAKLWTAGATPRKSATSGRSSDPGAPAAWVRWESSTTSAIRSPGACSALMLRTRMLIAPAAIGSFSSRPCAKTERLGAHGQAWRS